MKTVWDEYLATVEAAPDAVAVNDGQGIHTYAELHALVTSYQTALLERGVCQGDLVGVVMCRDMRLPAMLLALFGMGAAYLPIDPTDPVPRMQAAARIAGCAHVVGNRSHIDTLRKETAPEAGPNLHTVEDLNAANDGDRVPAPTPDMLAYVLMTSGSTGEPKAVSVLHSNVTTLLTSARDHLQFSASDHYFATSSLTFDASIPELFLPLTTGATVVIRDRDIVLSPKKMVATIEAAKVTIVQTTPSTWSAILSAVEAFPRIRLLITHGEPVTPTFAAELATRADRVLNMYGPTETTVWATSLELTPEISALSGQGAAPIGYPLNHVTAWVADAEGHPVEDGAAGELCLGGASVTQGYRNDPDRTKSAYFDRNGVRFYRTGDLVERAPDGLLKYLGRIDDQMAINGLRIEPGEIEAALMTHPSVGRGTVTWYETSTGARSIVAAVVPKPGKSVTPKDLRNHLSGRLNRSFLPSQYLFFGELPALTSGKVDRGAIRHAAREAAEANQSPTATAPLGKIEHRMAEIWTSVLKTHEVRREDDFFLVGGDSLRAVDLMVQIEKAFGVDLSIQDVFDHPTLAAMSAHMGALTPEENQATNASLMVGFRTDSPGTPLFFAHADLDYPNASGRSIPAPFYNLLLWSRAEGIVNEASLSDLAAKYVREITAAQPKGPYRLAGYSIGGIIIHDVAQQLIDLGHEVEFLFLLDPTPPGFMETTGKRSLVAPRRRNFSTRVSARLDRVARSMRGERKAGWAKALVEAPRYLNEVRHWWAYRRLSARFAAASGHPGADYDEATQWRAIRYAIGRMVAKYSAKPLGVPTILVTSHPEMAEVWEGLLGPDDKRHRINADHRGAFREPATAIWTKILVDEMTGAAVLRDRSMTDQHSEPVAPTALTR